MKSLVENVEAIDDLIRSMHKIHSFCMNGQVIQANREACSVMSKLQTAKKELVEAHQSNEEQPSENGNEQ